MRERQKPNRGAWRTRKSEQKTRGDWREEFPGFFLRRFSIISPLLFAFLSMSFSDPAIVLVCAKVQDARGLLTKARASSGNEIRLTV